MKAHRLTVFYCAMKFEEMRMRMYRDSENKQLHCTKLHLRKHKELTVTSRLHAFSNPVK